MNCASLSKIFKIVHVNNRKDFRVIWNKVKKNKKYYFCQWATCNNFLLDTYSVSGVTSIWHSPKFLRLLLSSFRAAYLSCWLSWKAFVPFTCEKSKGVCFSSCHTWPQCVSLPDPSFLIYLDLMNDFSASSNHICNCTEMACLRILSKHGITYHEYSSCKDFPTLWRLIFRELSQPLFPQFLSLIIL